MRCWILVSPRMGVVMEGDVVMCGCHRRFTVGQILPRLIPKFNKNISPLPFPPPSWNSGERRGGCNNGLTFPTDPSRWLCPPRCPRWKVPIHKPTPQGLKSRRLLKMTHFRGSFFKKILDLVNLCDFFPL